MLVKTTYELTEADIKEAVKLWLIHTGHLNENYSEKDVTVILTTNPVYGYGDRLDRHEVSAKVTVK